MGANASASDPAVYDQITDRQPPFDTANDDVATEAIDDMAAMMNTYISRRYSIPITNTDDLAALRPINRFLAEWQLWATQPANTEIPERVLQQYRQARDFLDALAAGEIKLPSEGSTSQMSFGSWEEVLTEDVSKQL